MTFEVIAEIEPPRRPGGSRHEAQLAELGSVTSRVLVPDNHMGRPAVSSLVVAAGITTHPTIACMNARDRNLLGVRRDLLTAQHLGVEELLVLRGDDLGVGGRTGGVGVRDIVAECAATGLRYSVTGSTGRLPSWKRGASRVFLQVGWTLDDLERRRESLDTDLPVYAGVLVLASSAMARRLAVRVPELRAPDAVVEALERDPLAGVAAAAELISQVRSSGYFGGVHLVPGVRAAETAAAIGPLLDVDTTRASAADHLGRTA